MPNVAASPNVSVSASLPAQHMGAGNFYGAIHGAREQCGAIFSDVRHASPRKLPKHSHELAFFALVLNGHYRERCGRRACLLRMFRSPNSASRSASPIKVTSRAPSAKSPA